MTIEFPEPKSEDEAQRIKHFLEAGGEVGLKEVDSFRADGTAAATLGQPGTLRFGASAAQVLRSLGAGANRRAVLTVDVGDLKPADQFSESSIRVCLDRGNDCAKEFGKIACSQR